eukprot:9487410-Pyramimonas_sp.AAC.1
MSSECRLPFDDIPIGCAGAVIDMHDHVFRVNAHNAGNKNSQQARDFGARTSIRTLTAALIT